MTQARRTPATGRPTLGRRSLALGGLLLALAALADAQQAYRWLDSDGNLHFGDQPPPPDARQAEPLPLPDYAAPERSPLEDPYSVLNQLQRLEARRAAAERERLEQERLAREYRLQREELTARQEPPPAPASGPIYGYPYPIYGSRPWVRPGRPHPGAYPPSEDHPAYRPHYRPPGPAPRPPAPAKRLLPP